MDKILQYAPVMPRRREIDRVAGFREPRLVQIFAGAVRAVGTHCTSGGACKARRFEGKPSAV